MITRTSVLAAVGALALASLVLAPVRADQTPLHTNRLTFSGPVGLPGVTLPGGSYVFERVVHTNRDVVVVRNAGRTHVYYMGMTDRVSRPSGLPRDRAITFGETPAGGGVVPITGWYPIGEDYGHSFIYRPR